MTYKLPPAIGALAMASVAMLALEGCAGSPPPVVGQNVQPGVLAADQETFAEPATYILRPADVIDVTVFREAELTAKGLVLSADGRISMPLIGSIEAAGLTPAELALAIRTAYASNGYLRRPDVAVNVARYASHRVAVEGAIERAGVYDFQPGERLSTSLALAGGLRRSAKQDQVVIFRPGPGGMTIAKFDYRAIAQGTMLDPQLRPGDRVVVGTSGLGQAWEDILRSVPVFGVFNQL